MTTNELPKLTLSYKEFKDEIEKFILEATNLFQNEVSTEAQLAEQQDKIKEWSNKVLAFLGTAFSDINNQWKHEFYNTRGMGFIIPGTQRNLQNEIKKQKESLQAKRTYLQFNLRILSVLDSVVRPDEINLEERKNLTTNGKLSLLLDKLYDLYDDVSYPVKEILLGNGIELKRHDEEYELAKMLQDRNWIEIHNFGYYAARLTSEGALFVEEQKQKIAEESEQNQKPNNMKPHNDKTKVFISHGGSHLWKDIARFIEKELGIDTVSLQERPNNGRTVIEKLEGETAECNFAIIVMTAEDAQGDGTLRARQNVVHEIGFCQGVFGRRNVLVLKQQGAEAFTNISGIVYEEFIGDNIKSAFERIRTEIKSLKDNQ